MSNSSDKKPQLRKGNKNSFPSSFSSAELKSKQSLVPKVCSSETSEEDLVIKNNKNIKKRTKFKSAINREKNHDKQEQEKKYSSHINNCAKSVGIEDGTQFSNLTPFMDSQTSFSDNILRKVNQPVVNKALESPAYHRRLVTYQ